MCCFGDLQTAKKVFSDLKKKGVKYIIGYKRFDHKFDKNGKIVITSCNNTNFIINKAGWIKAEGLESNYKYSCVNPRGIHVYFKSYYNRIPVKIMLNDIIAAEQSNLAVNKNFENNDITREFVATKVYIYKKDFNNLVNNKYIKTK
jgi:hypothetical protein